MKGLKEGDLSEDAGVEILKGLGTGLDNQYWKNKIFGKVSGLMGNIMGTLGIITGNKSLKLPGHENGLDYVPYDNYIATPASSDKSPSLSPFITSSTLLIPASSNNLLCCSSDNPVK